MRGEHSGRENAPRTYRMAELVAAAGVSREMIKYYLRARLLPPAEKPRPNLSLYTGQHLELIGLVRRFQEQTRLSLPDIAAVFESAGYEPSAIEIELLASRHSVPGDDNIIPLPGTGDEGRGLELPADFLRRLEQASLLRPGGGGAADHADQLAGLLWAAHEAGVPLEFFESARQKLEELADLEVKTLITLRRPELNYTDMLDNVSDVDRIINRWLVAEKSHQIRSRFQRVIDNSQRAISTLLDTIYRPSDLFRQRHGIEAALASVDADVESGVPSRDELHELCFVYLMLGEFERTLALADNMLADNAQDALAIALLALLHGLQNDADAAFDYGSRLDADPMQTPGQPVHAAVIQARLLSLLLKAEKLGGVTDTRELLKHAAEIFLGLPGEPTTDQPEAILLLARANVGFPDFANSRAEAIAALGALQAALDNGDDILPALGAKALAGARREVYRMYTQFYLGELLAAEGRHANARRCYEAVIQIDPASNFGERAYLQLGRLNA